MTLEQRHQQRERCQAAREQTMSAERSDALSRRRENYAISREMETNEERQLRSANNSNSLYFCNLVHPKSLALETNIYIFVAYCSNLLFC